MSFEVRLQLSAVASGSPEATFAQAATDAVIPEVERAHLKAIYPRARLHTFPTGGHLGNGIFMFDTTISLMREFLAAQSSEARPPR